MSANRLNPVLDAVASKVAALSISLPDAPGPLPVRKRKAPVRRQALDPAAMITVSKSETPELVTRWTFGTLRTDFVVDVILVTPFNGPDASQAEYALVRDRLVDAFRGPPLSGAPDVFEVRSEPADWLRPYGERTEWDWFACRVVASVIH